MPAYTHHATHMHRSPRRPLFLLFADSIALLGLNCYHLVKAGKGRNEEGIDIPFFSLLKAAAIDRVAAFMGVSMLILAFVAV
jgi:hypothetical protein